MIGFYPLRISARLSAILSIFLATCQPVYTNVHTNMPVLLPVQAFHYLRNSDLPKFQRKTNFAQVRTDFTYGHLYVYLQRSTVDIQTPTHWNLIGLSMTAPSRVLSPSSILPPPLTHCAFILAWNIRRAFQK
jgi:hypothetical protein